MEGKNLEKKSLNSFAIILRNILKLEKETEISDENNKVCFENHNNQS